MIPYRIRPRKCRHCRESFMPERLGQIVHVSCIEGYMAAEKAKKRAKEEAKRKAQAKVERARTRQRKTELKTIPDLIKEAQREFNAAIRERDKDKACISCGRPLRNGEGGSTGGDFDCGHFRSTGSAPHLRFEADNAAGQCKHCNRYLAGNVIGYRAGLIERIGLARVEQLEANNLVAKWRRDDLIALREKFRLWRKELEKQHG